MAKGNVTLKQIAEVAGVSTTTVHRVLNDKDGYAFVHDLTVNDWSNWRCDLQCSSGFVCLVFIERCLNEINYPNIT